MFKATGCFRVHEKDFGEGVCLGEFGRIFLSGSGGEFGVYSYLKMNTVMVFMRLGNNFNIKELYQVFDTFASHQKGFYSVLLYFIPIYFIPFYSTLLFYSIQFYSGLFYHF